MMPVDEPSTAPLGPTEVPAVAMGFEWRSFSGLVKLTGADGLLPAGATFWSALVPEDHGPLRDALARALDSPAPVKLPVRLQTSGGIRPFILHGKVVRTEPEASPRVSGVLLSSGCAPWPHGTSAVRLACAAGDALDGAGRILGAIAFVDGALRRDAIDRELAEPLLRSLSEARQVVERLQASGSSLLGLVQLQAVDDVQDIELPALLRGLVARHPDVARGRKVAVRIAEPERARVVSSLAHLEYAVRLALDFVADCVPPGVPPGAPLSLTIRPAPADGLELAFEPFLPAVLAVGDLPRPLPPGAQVQLAVCRAVVERLGGVMRVSVGPGALLGVRVILPRALIP